MEKRVKQTVELVLQVYNLHGIHQSPTCITPTYLALPSRFKIQIDRAGLFVADQDGNQIYIFKVVNPDKFHNCGFGTNMWY